MKSADSTMMYNIPVVSELNKVSNFDPLRYLRKTENGMELPLKFKKLWFRLKYPQGRVRLSNIRITDQLAIIEARIFLDRKDTESVSSYTASCDAQSAPDGQFLKFAQELAIGQALNDAGFGIQFVSADGELSPAASFTATPVKETKTEAKEPAPSVQQTKNMHPIIEKAEPVTEIPVEQTITIDENDFEEIVVDSPTETVPEPVSTAAQTVSAVTDKPIEKITLLETASVPSFTVIEDESVSVAAESDKPSAPAYTKEMPVEQICNVMTLEEAENYVVPSGACMGQKLSQGCRSQTCKFALLYEWI